MVSAATVQVAVDGRPAGLLTSEKRQHVDSFKRPTFEPSTEVGIRSGLREDLYMVFAGAVNGTEEAVYRFNINPLVWWVWFGGLRARLRRDRHHVAGWRARRGAVAPGAGRLRGVARRGGEGVSDTIRRPTRFPSPRIGARCRCAPAADDRAGVRDASRGGGRAPGLAGRPRRDRHAARPLRGGASRRRPPTPRRTPRRSRRSSCGWPATAAARSTSSPAAPPTSPAPTLRDSIARCSRCGARA